MAKNGNNELEKNGAIGEETLREIAEAARIGNRAVKKAQEENRRLGIPNWYSIGGVIVSDQEIARLKTGDGDGDS